MRVRLDPLAPPPVAAAATRAGDSSPDYAVRPADFAAQLEWLMGHGYHFVSVDPVLLSFDDGANRPGVPLSALRRRNVGDNARAAKVMHVDLDNIHNPDPAQTKRNLQLLLSRIQAMGVNRVYPQAFADPAGHGTACFVDGAERLPPCTTWP